MVLLRRTSKQLKLMSELWSRTLACQWNSGMKLQSSMLIFGIKQTLDPLLTEVWLAQRKHGLARHPQLIICEYGEVHVSHTRTQRQYQLDSIQINKFTATEME